MKRLLVPLLILVLAAPAAAFASTIPTLPVAASAHASATAQGLAAAKPAVPNQLDVQLWPEDSPDKMAVLIVGRLSTDTPLPARVTLPLPKGATIRWAGEIFESSKPDIRQDPTVAPDGKSVTLIAVESRLVQVESVYTRTKDSGGRRYATLDWVQSQPAGKMLFGFKLPLAAEDPKSDPGYVGHPATNAQGEKVYVLAPRSLALGQAFKLQVDYLPSQPANFAAGPDMLLIVVAVLLVISLAALGFMLIRARKSA
jgi:hypothetical protein